MSKNSLAGLFCAVGLSTIAWSLLLHNPPGGELGVVLFIFGAALGMLP